MRKVEPSAKSKMAARGPQDCRRNLEMGLILVSILDSILQNQKWLPGGPKMADSV